MELELKNIGRIEKANIKIDGITVICGDNNTGKSTVGKILYVIFQTFCNFPDKIENERIHALRNIIAHKSSGSDEKMNPYIGELWNSLRTIDVETSYIGITERQKKIKDAISRIFDNNDSGNDSTDSLKGMILSVMEQKEEDILGAILKNYLKAEFGTRIGNVNYPRRKSEVQLKLRDGNILFSSLNGGIESNLKEYINLKKKIVYIDDPFLLDSLDSSSYFRMRTRYKHRMALQEILLKGSMTSNSSVIEDLITEKRLEPILEKFDSISSGNLVYKDGTVKYESDRFKSDLDLVSVSTGIKSFIILKELLMNGSIEENGIIVIDEPEVHLHPEWQIRYAEIIVMLHKYYGLNILLTTHSDEFLSAIQLYSKRYDIEEKCHYYLTKLKKAKDSDEMPLSYFEETTKNLEEVYASLSQPYLDVYSQLNEEE